MPEGTPDYTVGESSGTPDFAVGEGELLTEAEHDARDHTGVPGTAADLLTATSVTDSTGGTTDGVVDALGDVGVPGLLSGAAARDDVNDRMATINDNFAELAAKVNQIISDLGG